MPGPDPKSLELELLEARLRAIAPPAVPERLVEKLAVGIPRAGASSGGLLNKPRLWFAACAAMVVIIAAVSVAVWSHWGSGSGRRNAGGPQQNGGSGVPNTIKNQAIGQYEHAVAVDPYNAEAWFNLAKAQADAGRWDEAISSAQKSIDIARSRGRTDFVHMVEAWVKSLQHRDLPRE